MGIKQVSRCCNSQSTPATHGPWSGPQTVGVVRGWNPKIRLFDLDQRSTRTVRGSDHGPLTGSVVGHSKIVPSIDHGGTYRLQVEQPFSVWETPGDHVLAHMVQTIVKQYKTQRRVGVKFTGSGLACWNYRWSEEPFDGSSNGLGDHQEYFSPLLQLVLFLLLVSVLALPLSQHT
uniref:Uncharacterized protein n=1 Tax=Solanum tuberosum TaxID=4113 RepID=M1DG14_SOLTU